MSRSRIIFSLPMAGAAIENDAALLNTMYIAECIDSFIHALIQFPM
jgi:hypothetical protein